MDPRVALLCVLSFVTVQAATPIEEWWRFVGYGLLLMVAVVGAQVSPGWLLRRMRLALPFLVAVAVSALVVRPLGGTGIILPVIGLEISRSLVALLASVAVKATLGIVALSLPTALWETPVLLQALQSLGVPRLFVIVTALMWRYVYLLGGEGQRMIQAREARGSPERLLRRIQVTSAMIGSLFIRGYERAERVGQAMVARGYDGTIRLLQPLRRFRLADAGIVLVVTAALCAVRLVGAR
ncbi:MAG: energy-coupling factor transporter transmembrane component T family protein [Candidatus Zipacnadales bacterium]